MTLSVKKLRDDLELWIQLGIDDDIVRMPDLRPEYQHLLAKHKNTQSVLTALNIECRRPWYRRPTFWKLLWMKATKWKRK